LKDLCDRGVENERGLLSEQQREKKIIMTSMVKINDPSDMNIHSITDTELIEKRAPKVFDMKA
jgi:hypothetical protein